MVFKKIIADSGGTKTDWLCVDEQGEMVKLQTKSYHPMHLTAAFITAEQRFWSNYDIGSCHLEFYGAGCLAEEGQEVTKRALEQMCFKNPKVQSDLYAAAYALEVTDGWVAICGTGSVVFRMEKNRIVELRGGLGWELGDEGSGYYFGKMLVKRLQSEATAHLEIKERIEEWMSLDALWRLEDHPDSKFIYAHLAQLLSDFSENAFLKNLHSENLSLFVEKYCNKIDFLNVVGSYTFFNQDVMREVCLSVGIQLNRVVSRPLDVLSKQPEFLR